MNVINAAGLILKRNAPGILMACGTALTVGGVVLAATKGSAIISKAAHAASVSDKLTEPVPTKALRIFRDTARETIPVAVLIGGGIACFYGANHITEKRVAAAMSLYASSTAALSSVKEQLKERLGEEAAKEVVDKVLSDSEEKLDEAPAEADLDGCGDTLIYDRVTGRYFKSTVADIRKAEATIVKRTVDEVFVSLNQFYEELGLPDFSYIGDAIGWDSDRTRLDIAFHSMLKDGETPCLVISYSTTVIDRNALRTV